MWRSSPLAGGRPMETNSGAVIQDAVTIAHCRKVLDDSAP